MIRRPPRSTLFPTRRSSDLLAEVHFTLGSVYQATGKTAEALVELKQALQLAPNSDEGYRRLDRKSTRLNSSHLVISYAVFCLKKKKKKQKTQHTLADSIRHI